MRTNPVRLGASLSRIASMVTQTTQTTQTTYTGEDW